MQISILFMNRFMLLVNFCYWLRGKIYLTKYIFFRMKIDPDDKEKALFTEGVKSTQNKPQQQTFDRTPQFLYHKWEIVFHYVFYLGTMIIMISTIHNYIITYYEEIKPLLTRSYLSDFIDQNFRPSQKTSPQDSMSLLEILPSFSLSIYRYNSDPQWQSYRNNLLILISVALVWRFLTYAFYLFDSLMKKYNNKSMQKDNHFSYVNGNIFVLSLAVLLFSFRADVFLYLGVIVGWWAYVESLMKIRARIKEKREGMKVTVKQFNSLAIGSFWIIMLVTLLLNQKFSHFRQLSKGFQKLIPDFLEPLKNSHRAIHCSQFLNMTFLRLLSYGIDRIHEGNQQWEENEKTLKERRLIVCDQCEVQKSGLVRFCNKGRDHVIKRYHSLKDYLNYTLYTPLLLTGPPISYNNFFSYQQLPAPRVTIKQYIHHILLIFSFEIYLHLFPVVTPNASMSLAQMQVFSLFYLVFIWYKFLIIWKTARIWSKMYGVEVIDNMSRCIFNNYGFEGFWRMWHRGFNHWLIRYLYVPLGGKENIWSVLTVVSFVAFWHDHTINIIFWGLIIALFMVPQLLIKRYFRKNMRHLYGTYWFKYLAGFVSSIYIHFLIICNCIGFGYGVGQMELIFDKIIAEYQTMICSIFVVTIPTLCMFHIRNLEGNKKNY